MKPEWAGCEQAVRLPLHAQETALWGEGTAGELQAPRPLRALTCFHVCTVCVYVFVQTLHVCGDPRLKPGVFLFIRQALSIKPRTHQEGYSRWPACSGAFPAIMPAQHQCGF